MPGLMRPKIPCDLAIMGGLTYLVRLMEVPRSSLKTRMVILTIPYLARTAHGPRPGNPMDSQVRKYPGGVPYTKI